MNLDEIKFQATEVFEQLFSCGQIKKGNIVVAGCSSSEICGGLIGHDSSEEIGKAVFAALNESALKHGVFLACQCCEHLNRAIVIEREAAERYGLEEVSVVPWLKGGGSFATAAYAGFSDPVVVEQVRAHVGIDVGDTLIGMHLKAVAVPFRIQRKEIGNARVVCAYTRPKLIGGERARYK